ncbi:MAG: glucosyl-3-phosphoglycerate synthase [Actinobacteria bacterium]|nr:glucosyl-3-phosphoglycerate synthase [Actinomycetota bacterium]
MAAHEQSLQAARDWATRRTYRTDEPAGEMLARLRETSGQSISVVIPAKSCASTIGDVASRCVELREAGAVDEVVVIDAAASSDGTAQVAADAGATVRQEDDLLPEFGPAIGKGDAMWRAQAAVTGDVIVYVDGDSEGFDPGFVAGLAMPLLSGEPVRLVKGAFRRPFASGELRLADGGGRVSELAARPLLNLFFPELAAVQQPLAGEYAARADALAAMPFLTGYGAEIQLLLDFYKRFGLDSVAQSDIGERVNPHQPLHDLGAMAFAVSRAILSRVDPERHGLERHREFVNYVAGEAVLRDVPLVERPPYAEVMERSHGA